MKLQQHCLKASAELQLIITLSDVDRTGILAELESWLYFATFKGPVVTHGPPSPPAVLVAISNIIVHKCLLSLPVKTSSL